MVLWNFLDLYSQLVMPSTPQMSPSVSTPDGHVSNRGQETSVLHNSPSPSAGLSPVHSPGSPGFLHNGLPTQSRAQPDFIELVNTLQTKLSRVGHNPDFQLPQIVVVGSQSAGKSSVLENIVGKEFLPRGTGVVTRRPTIVQMYPIPGEEYATFGHSGDSVRYTDFTKVRDEIIAQTLQIPGPTGFSNEPILIKIYSPRVLKLTLVDLPGLVKVAVEGQPESCVKDIRDMVLSFISNEKIIILAVTPANQDLANSDALQIAKEVDPQRERTIGVLTKLDCMPPGEDAKNILENRVLPLKKGYVAVVNRSREDIRNGVLIEDILKKEKMFFENDPAYRHLAHRMGTPYLQKLLQKTLRLHIKSFLPNVKTELSKTFYDCHKELKELTEKLGDETTGKQFLMIQVMQSFAEDISVKLFGNSEEVDMEDLSPGTEMYCRLYKEVKAVLTLDLKPDEKKLALAMANMSGIKSSLTAHNQVVHSVLRKMIPEYKIPLKESVDCIASVLKDAIEDSAATMMDEYPNLKSSILYRVHCCIAEEVERTQERLCEHVDAETFFMNFGHPDFDISSCDSTAPRPDAPLFMWNSLEAESSGAAFSRAEIINSLPQQGNIKENVACLKNLLMKYLNLVQIQICDVAIKYIVFFLVKKVELFIRKKMMATVLNDTTLSTLEEDCEEGYRKKDELQVQQACIKDALEFISKF